MQSLYVTMDLNSHNCSACDVFFVALCLYIPYRGGMRRMSRSQANFEPDVIPENLYMVQTNETI